MGRVKVFFILLCASGLLLVTPQHPQAAPKAALRSLSLYLQPHRRTKLSVNGKPINFRVLRRNNTLALISINVPTEDDELTITAEHKKFETLTLRLKPTAEFERLKTRIPRLMQLRRPGAHFELLSYVKSGTWPKSVTFLDTQRVVVPLLEARGVDVINIHTNEKKRLRVPGPHGRHKGYVETLVLPDRGEFWVSQMTTAAVHIFGISDLAYRSSIKLRANWSKVLLRDTRRQQVFVSNWSSKNISVIDLATLTETKRIPAAGVPRGMALSPDGKFLYAGQFTHIGESDGRGRVLKIDPDKGKIVKYLGTYGAKRHLVSDRKGRLFVSDMARARIEVFDMNKDEEIKRIPVYYKPNTIALSPDERYLYVSCRGPNNPAGYTKPGLKMGRIYVIDTEKLEVAEWFEGGNQPTGLDVSSDGSLLVTSDFMDSRLRIYRRLAH